ncbi:MAG: ribosome small subunit-dependent GTPase A [Bacteroidales bacterium]|nr:ribosome small subunit-dependent GTPase A [Bacteroidales bacterium]
MENQTSQGTVVKSTGNEYTVRRADGSLTLCKLRGQFRLRGLKSTNPIAVGDHVRYLPDSGQGYGTITEIAPRKNYISRKSVNLSKVTHLLAANIDSLFLMVTPCKPRTPLGFIDRFLTAAESFRIESTLVFNKTDLYSRDDWEQTGQLQEVYRRIGYRCLSVSALTGEGLEELKDCMRGKVSLVGGQSGVGKSTLINAISPGLNLKTSPISDSYEKGKHTTTFAEMFPLAFGGDIIDTPGIKEFGLIQYEKEEVGHYFPEMLSLLEQCRFSNCTHTHEPGCAVKAAVEAGEIAPSRYRNYLSIIENEDLNLKDWMLE